MAERGGDDATDSVVEVGRGGDDDGVLAGRLGEQRQVGAVHLEGSGQVAYADGERVGHLPVDVTTLPGGVRIIVPSSAPSA